MFTSISKLRDSDAQQNRVTVVENALKRRFGTWEPQMPFPMAFIIVSNNKADYEWVKQTKQEILVSGLNTAARKNALKAFLKQNGVEEGWDEGVVTKASAEKVCGLIAQFCIKEDIVGSSLAMFIPAKTEATPAPAVKTGASGLPLKKVAKKPVNKLLAPAAVKPALATVTGRSASSGPSQKSNVPKSGIKKVQVKKEPKPVKKYLPLPSVLKQIRDLVKGHPKIQLSEKKPDGVLSVGTITITY